MRPVTSFENSVEPITYVTVHCEQKYAKIFNRDFGRRFTMNRRSLLIALLGASGAMAGTVAAQRSGAMKPQDKFALANEDVKELLLLMDTDKSGKISKQEWMHFMEAEFNTLDKDGSGELDPKELLQTKLSIKAR